MLFNVKRESYVAGRGSIATECLPDGIRQDIITEGNQSINSYNSLYDMYNDTHSHTHSYVHTYIHAYVHTCTCLCKYIHI